MPRSGSSIWDGVNPNYKKKAKKLIIAQCSKVFNANNFKLKQYAKKEQRQRRTRY